MPNFCDLKPDGDKFKCVYCGQRVTPFGSGPITVRCLTAPVLTETVEEPAGLGDRTETLLGSIGITPDFVGQVKQLFGFAPTCECEARKQWLNDVGRWFQGRGG